jgi:hypothetical protein
MNNLKKFLVAIIAIVSAITVNAGTDDLNNMQFYIRLSLMNENNETDTVYLQKEKRNIKLVYPTNGNIANELKLYKTSRIQYKAYDQTFVYDSINFYVSNKNVKNNSLALCSVSANNFSSYFEYEEKLMKTLRVLDCFYTDDFTFEIKIFDSPKSIIPKTVYKITEVCAFKSEEAAKNNIIKNPETTNLKEVVTFLSTSYDSFEEKLDIYYHSYDAYTNMFSYRKEFYCGFEFKDKKPSNLVFCTTYISEDWLFIYEIRFKINGVIYKLTNLNMKTEVISGRRIIEYWYPYVSKNHQVKELLDALLEAEDYVEVQYVGTKGIENHTIRKFQVQAIQDCIKDFKDLGGIY